MAEQRTARQFGAAGLTECLLPRAASPNSCTSSVGSVTLSSRPTTSTDATGIRRRCALSIEQTVHNQ